LAADAVVLVHFLFVAFVLGGALLVWLRPWLALLHLPAALWGAAVELGGWLCPLTPLEQYWRRLAGQAGYQGGFIDHYLLPLIYPPGLTRDLQVALGALVLLLNLVLYGLAWRHHRRS
jgi:hypothetical protein